MSLYVLTSLIVGSMLLPLVIAAGTAAITEECAGMRSVVAGIVGAIVWVIAAGVAAGLYFYGYNTYPEVWGRDGMKLLAGMLLLINLVVAYAMVMPPKNDPSR